MKFKPNPLLYGANEDFLSTFRLAIRLIDTVDFDILSRAVEKARVRYPYFCVFAKRVGEDLELHYNSLPLPVFPDDRAVTLGSTEANGHLISFGCKDNSIFIDCSHYLADGMGVEPLMKSLLYLYVCERYGEDGICADRIRMVDSEISQGEYIYPFPDSEIATEQLIALEKLPQEVYSLDPDTFQKGGLYAYHLRVPQKEMMQKANTSDGSPVSFLSVLLYRAIHKLDSNIDKPIVAHVQHQYRAALRTPLSHHSLVNYIPVSMPARLNKWDVQMQNTIVRGQVILKGDKEADIRSVNRLINAFPSEASFDEKHKAMDRFARNSTLGKTFGISYVGRLDWCGLDRYIKDLHAYIGEKHTKNMLLIEVMTVGGDFSLTFMQSGKGEKYLNGFMDEICALDIPVSLVGEENFNLCNTKLNI